MKDADERVLELLREARRQLELERSRREEPIAIVGIGCRFPGQVSNPEEFWRLLRDGVDASSEVPRGRWNADAFYDPDPEASGKSYTRRGSFLESIDAFEPEFFGISPREAAGMDPQQRLLLEVVWEALEDAAIVPDSLRGTETGVWLGLCLDDYAGRSLWSGDASNIDAYSALGNTRSVAAGRISYVLDLRGPTVQLDTACSSSLVAVHQACQSLRARECNLALVGGVNLLCAPESTIALCKLRALSPDGRCKTFDAAADGYGRGEGCAMIVLERLSDAQRAGHRIYAVVRGSAVNHDGHSNGLTAPSGLAQEAVLKAALANAGTEPADVDLVEAHGTGTLLGDPIEVLALSRVYGVSRAPDSPLRLGTVKTNFGHLEGAAGVAGLIKVALCLSHGEMAPSLHLQSPNPKIPWSSLPVRVVTACRPWRRSEKVRSAGVSSFGISGTNAHVVLAEAPVLAPPAPAPVRSAELVVLSARSSAALAALAGRLRQHLEAHPELQLADVAFSLAITRSTFDHRLALAVPSRQALLEALEHAAAGAGSEQVKAPARASQGAIVFVFPGQGSQWLGMGRTLLEEEPVFRAALSECDRAIQAETGWSVLQELRASPEHSRLARVDVVQPVLFALQVALAALWRSWGVEPTAVVGHSMGEVAAACVAGALSLGDGAAVICRRSQLLLQISGQGEMALVELALEDARAALVGYEERLAVAVSNGPRSTVISGHPDALTQVLARLEARGVFCRRVKVDVASHSPQVDPLLGELRARLQGLKPRSAQLSMHSTVTGARVEGTELDAVYWADNLREPVRFGATVEALMKEGWTHFVEISPHPLLVTAVEQLRADLGVEGVAVGSLRREQPERRTLLEALGVLHVQGHSLNVERLFPAGQRVPLPTYPWQRKSYWLKSPEVGRRSAGTSTGHPLLGVRIVRAGADAVYESVLPTQDASWLTEHKLCGQAVVPASVLGELMRAAAEERAQGAAHELSNLQFQAPLLLPASGALRIQVTVFDRCARASVHSQPAEADPEAGWALHATADLALMPELVPAGLDVEGCRQRCSSEINVSELYEALRARGVEWGASLRGLRRLWRGPREALAEIELECELDDHYPVHPALLEAAVQGLTALSGAVPGMPMRPSDLGRLAIHRTGAVSVLAHFELQAAAAEEVVARVTLTEPSGAIIAELGSARLRAADLGALAEAQAARVPDIFFRLVWRELEHPARASQLQGSWRILSSPDSASAERLARELGELGAEAQALVSSPLLELPAVDHVVCLFDTREEDSAEEALRTASLGLTVIRALTRHPRSPRIWWVTRSAIQVREQEALRPAGATIWGLGRTASQEQPELPLVLLDVESERSLPSALLEEASAEDQESQVAWRDGKRFGARLVRASASAPPALQRGSGGSDGAAWIIGAVDAPVAAMTRQLVQRGIRHLLFSSDGRGEPAETRRWIAELEARGARVTVAAIDVADRQALAGLLASIPQRQPLRAIVHASVTSDDGLLPDQTAARLSTAMAQQVRGAWNLHLLTERLDLDHFILFSSVSGTLGSASQGAAAAAAAFLDALAAHRRAQGRAATSIAWGPWWEPGRALAQREGQRARLARMGIGMLSPHQGQALSRAALERPESQFLVVPMDLRTMAKAAEPAIPSLLRSLLRTPVARAKAAPRHWARELLALPEEQRFASVLSLVRGAVAAILSLSSPEAVPSDRALRDLGLDSLMAVELRNSLARRTGVTARASLAFDVALSTPATIAQRLLDTLLDDGAPFHSRSYVKDGELSAALTANPREPEWANPKRVLLTGATGFLGAFLLGELLQQTSARVTCLVRAPDARAGAARVIENLERYGLWKDSARDRIDVIVGDLTEPHLGVSPAVWTELAQTVDSIYSNASHVSYVATYEELRASHIGATNEMLRLSCSGRPKVLNHVSSIAAYDSRSYRGRDLPEAALPEVGVGFHLPYSQCKWATESLVRQAGLRGVPVVIYRPGFIGGSSTTGAWSAGDFMCRLFASLIQQESFPIDLDVLFDFSPADYVARSMVFLSRRPASRGHAFNLQNPNGIAFASVREILVDLGYRMNPMSYLRWLDVLSERRDPALYPLLPFLRDPASSEGHSNLELAQRKFRPRLSCNETVRAVAEGGIRCPAIDHALISRYLDYMAAHDLIASVSAARTRQVT